MISLLIFGFVASAIAGPHFGRHHGPGGPPPFGYPWNPDHGPHFGPGHPHHCFGNNEEEIKNLKEDMNSKLKNIEDTLGELMKRLPTVFQETNELQEGIKGNEYKIKIPLAGFELKDIVVKISKNRLFVQAIRMNPDGSQKNYYEIKNIPDTVSTDGSWVYEKSIVKVTFPLKTGGGAVETVTVAPPECSTALPQNQDHTGKPDAGFLEPRLFDENGDLLPNFDVDVGALELLLNLNHDEAEGEIETLLNLNSNEKPTESSSKLPEY